MLAALVLLIFGVTLCVSKHKVAGWLMILLAGVVAFLTV